MVAEIEQLRQECFALAATQCEEPTVGEHGTLVCLRVRSERHKTLSDAENVARGYAKLAKECEAAATPQMAVYHRIYQDIANAIADDIIALDADVKSGG